MTLILLMYALFATSPTISKFLLQYSSPIFYAGIRMLIAGIALLAYQYFIAHQGFRLKKSHMWLYIQSSFFGIYITYMLRFWSLNYLTSAKVAFFHNLAPFFSAFYSYLFFSERMTNKRWAGLFIGVIGFIPILISTSPAEASLGELFYISWPEAAIICSVAFHSFSWVVLRKMVRDKSYTPAMANGISMTAGGLLALITAFFVEASPYVTHTTKFVGWTIIVILISNIICYNLYGYLLKKYSATFLSFAGFLAPIFTAFYGWAFLGEPITIYYYISTILVFFGLYLFYKDELNLQKEATVPLEEIE